MEYQNFRPGFRPNGRGRGGGYQNNYGHNHYGGNQPSQNFNNQGGNQPIQSFQPRPCRFRWSCGYILKQGCKNAHHPLDTELARTYKKIKYASFKVVAVVNQQGYLELLMDNKFPIQMMQQNDLWQDKYYLLTLAEFDINSNGLRILKQEEFGQIGDYDVEKKINEEYLGKRKYYRDFIKNEELQNPEDLELSNEDDEVEEEKKDQDIEESKEIPIVSDEKKIEQASNIVNEEEKVEYNNDNQIFMGVFNARERQTSIKSNSHKSKIFFGGSLKQQQFDYNRALPKCKVYFKIKPQVQDLDQNQPENANDQNQHLQPKLYAEVVNVRYPQNLIKYGIIEITTKGIQFRPMDKNFLPMTVKAIESELFEKIKLNETDISYSFLRSTPIKQEYIRNYFFKAQFIEWSIYDEFASVKLIEMNGRTDNLKTFKEVIMYENGINAEMYPYHAQKQAEELNSTFDQQLVDSLSDRKDLTTELVFTIDNPSTKAFDDAISMKRNEDGSFTIMIHISDVAQIIEPDTPIDKEAMKRTKTTYVQEIFFLPMLPYMVNAGICSLIQNSMRFAITLSFNMNQEGIIDVDSVDFDRSIIESKIRLSYQDADDLIFDKKIEDSKESSFSKLSEDQQKELISNLKDLHKIMTKRREFRSQFDKTDNAEDKFESAKCIEELMLIQNILIPVFKNRIIDMAEQAVKDLISKHGESILDVQEELLLQKAKSVKKINVEDDFFSMIEFEQGLQKQTSIGAEKYLQFLFEQFKSQLITNSRKHILNSFQQIKEQRQSQIVDSFLDTVYARNYQYFSYMVQRYHQAHPEEIEAMKAEEEAKAKENQDSVEEEKKLEAKEDSLNEALEKLSIKDKSPYDTLINGKIIKEYLEIPNDSKMKFTNPIRSYSDLLTNRLIHKLINIRNSVNSKTDTKEHIDALNKEIDEVLQQIRKQVLYQKEIEFIRQNDKKMKEAEREISKIQFAFEVNQGTVVERALIIKKYSKSVEAYHPRIQEFSVFSKGHELPVTEEFDIEISIQSLVPLNYRAQVKMPEAENNEQ